MKIQAICLLLIKPESLYRNDTELRGTAIRYASPGISLGVYSSASAAFSPSASTKVQSY